MITEIPSPGCVGANSPFLPSISSVRTTFDDTFHATTDFQDVELPVQITGVGFFDFLHGQRGAAPNGIELHPVPDIVFNPGAPLTTETYYANVGNAPVHNCPATSCAVLASLNYGKAIQVIEVVQGESFDGIADWLHIHVVGVDGYIYGPFAALPTGLTQASGSPVSTVPAALSTPPPASTWNCTGDQYNCSDFSTCDELMSFWNTCPHDPSRLDRDGDGHPCESLCGG
jgi:hypothetical protein